MSSRYKRPIEQPIIIPGIKTPAGTQIPYVITKNTYQSAKYINKFHTISMPLSESSTEFAIISGYLKN